jgi:MATE family multidrug resistance protein
MLAIATLYLAMPERVLGWFAPDGPAAVQLIAVGGPMLVISALWQVFDATAMTLYETLRAAGDTAWTAAARIAIAWLVFTPAAYAAVRVWHGGALGAMACLVGYLAILAVAMAWRFRSGAWRRIVMIDDPLV